MKYAMNVCLLFNSKRFSDWERRQKYSPSIWSKFVFAARCILLNSSPIYMQSFTAESNKWTLSPPSLDQFTSAWICRLNCSSNAVPFQFEKENIRFYTHYIFRTKIMPHLRSNQRRSELPRIRHFESIHCISSVKHFTIHLNVLLVVLH